MSDSRLATVEQRSAARQGTLLRLDHGHRKKRGSHLFRVWRTFGVGLVLSFYFLFLAPFGYAAFAIWAALPTEDPRLRARRIQRCMGFAFGSMHVALRWMRILDFDPREVEGKIPVEPCILVSNHPTLVDISSMLALEPNLIFPVKASLFRNAWARPMFEAAGQLHIPQGDPFAIGGVVQTAANRLAAGDRLLIFPEGTRSPAGGLHPFGRMAFEIAVRQNVPIVPIVITCEPRWLTRDRSFFAKVKTVPKVRIRVLEPIHPAELPPTGPQGSSSRTLRDIVSRRIHTELGLSWSAKPSGQSDGLGAKNEERLRGAEGATPPSESSSLPRTTHESSPERVIEDHDVRIA